MDNQCILQLCDPDALAPLDAIRLARQVSRVEPDLALNLGAFVGHLSQSPEIDRRALRRALELLYAVSGEQAFSRICERMSRNENPVVRSLFRWLCYETPRRMRRAYAKG
ncbi:MAG: hypothetical protein JWP63_2518 [Candidatus Solibacter sp.]|nr:hypothetical protein [Candidatus Solibacter sp.]